MDGQVVRTDCITFFANVVSSLTGQLTASPYPLLQPFVAKVT